ncbi:MAG: thymidine phosphorylase [Planctomycetes bacterium]|nr:thymidine phosphorylase [Planctomycetota bacterium]
MDVRDVIAKKRDGGTLAPAEMRFFLEGYVAGTIEDYHASALLMAIFVHGMAPAELACWTEAMMRSGRVLHFADLGRPTSDKHSTGGIGDKASLPLAPAVAACGVSVPMISGRGLGHTGGTLDKLESIPGFRTTLDEREFEAALRAEGVAFGAQTADLVPADRKLYALRDATGLVPSLPLIASSILSKKLAEGAESLVLDVKFGSGAFLADPAEGERLGRTMIEICAGLGVPARVLLTAMDRPLGRAVGHVNEVQESLACLRGGGPPDLRALVLALGGEMLHLAGVAPTLADGEARIAASLDDGSALAVFERVVARQGGTPGVWCKPEDHASQLDRDELVAPRAGRLAFGDLRELGLALIDLGGGRHAMTDALDHGVGLDWLADAGDAVEAGQPLCTIRHRAGRGLADARARLARAVDVRDAYAPPPLVRARLG